MGPVIIIAKVLLQKLWLQKIELPAEILNDWQTSAKWSKELASLGIKTSFTSVYFPQGNSTERANREIDRLLRSLCFQKHTGWVYVVPEVENLLNQVVHDSTEFTPNEVHFHKSRKFPIDITFPEQFSLPDHEVVLKLAGDCLKIKAMRRQECHNNQGRTIEFVGGDQVYVRAHPLWGGQTIKKFFLLFEGSYTVMARKAMNFTNYAMNKD